MKFAACWAYECLEIEGRDGAWETLSCLPLMFVVALLVALLALLLTILYALERMEDEIGRGVTERFGTFYYEGYIISIQQLFFMLTINTI